MLTYTQTHLRGCCLQGHSWECTVEWAWWHTRFIVQNRRFRHNSHLPNWEEQNKSPIIWRGGDWVHWCGVLPVEKSWSLFQHSRVQGSLMKWANSYYSHCRIKNKPFSKILSLWTSKKYARKTKSFTLFWNPYPMYATILSKEVEGGKCYQPLVDSLTA